MALNIKNEEVERLVSEIAGLSGESKTEAVRRALLARKAALSHERERAARIESFLRYLEEEIWPAIPGGECGVPLSKEEREAILGYGPEGV
ncbi:MAG TPA: type II toxin-antitoxin system VapB family antitoxin [Thermoanaerobaculia bacterium]|nr:type II toxin-antitoxin system VapB family antitoxin [Thermoanaerobaculia bacterium]